MNVFLDVQTLPLSKLLLGLPVEQRSFKQLQKAISDQRQFMTICQSEKAKSRHLQCLRPLGHLE